MKYCFNDLNSLYSDFKNSARNAFGTYWEEELGSEKIPANFRNCIEEMTSAIKRAMRIADIVIANNIVAEKQKELKEAENTLKDLESSEALNRIADAIETKNALGVSFKVERRFDPSDGPFCSQELEESEGFADMT